MHHDPSINRRPLWRAPGAALLFALALAPAWAEETPLETAIATIESVPLQRVFDGTVEAVNQATISAQTSGRIAAVNFDVDDYVQAGDVVVQFTDVEQRAALNQAEAALAEARARRTETEENYRRARDLRERGLGSQRDLDQALAARDTAVARVASAESAVEAARQQLEYTMVRAPYPGIVTERLVEVGEAVTPGQPLMSGLSLDQLRVRVDLPQQVALEVRENPRAVIETVTQAVEPTRITVFPVADAATNTFRVRLELPEGQFGLYPGMFVKVAFMVGDGERLLIPAAALLRRSEVTGVYVVDDGGVVRLRQVRVGKAFGERVEILAGVEPGERVALDPVRAGIYVKTRTVPES